MHVIIKEKSDPNRFLKFIRKDRVAYFIEETADGRMHICCIIAVKESKRGWSGYTPGITGLPIKLFFSRSLWEEHEQ